MITGFSSWLDGARRQFSQRVKDTFLVILGDDRGRIDVPNKTGMVYVRLIVGADASGSTQSSPAIEVRSAVGATYLPIAGQYVRVGLDDDGELSIRGGDWGNMVASGINPQVTNAANPRNKFIYLENVVRLFSQAIGTTNTPSTQINVQPYISVNGYRTLRAYLGGKVDLASYIPVSGEHRLTMIHLKEDGTLQVTASTSQSNFTPLDTSDYQECLDAAEGDTIPIVAYRLANAQTKITDADKWEDMRQFINTFQPRGFPTVITQRERIAPNYQVSVRGGLTVSAQGLTVLGELWVV